MDKREWLSVMLVKEKVRELDLQKMERSSGEEICGVLEALRAKEILRFSKLLISEFGKEKAKKLIEDAVYSDYCNAGREAAEKLGNPQGLDAYLDAYAVKAVAAMPFAPHTFLSERTKNKAVWGVTKCYFANGLQKFGSSDPETLDVAKARCVHDAAWAMGFNPKMTCKRTKYLLDGDDACEWTCELEE